MNGKDEPFFHNEKRCKGCERKASIVDAGGRQDKWFCFGVTTSETRKTQNIPEGDKLRFCIKHPPLEKLQERNLFQLNLTKDEVEAITRRFLHVLRI